ncbi:hypothetical protein L9F63_016019, partial [Diploptera punctata]
AILTNFSLCTGHSPSTYLPLFVTEFYYLSLVNYLLSSHEGKRNHCKNNYNKGSGILEF